MKILFIFFILSVSPSSYGNSIPKELKGLEGFLKAIIKKVPVKKLKSSAYVIKTQAKKIGSQLNINSASELRFLPDKIYNLLSIKAKKAYIPLSKLNNYKDLFQKSWSPLLTYGFLENVPDILNGKLLSVPSYDLSTIFSTNNIDIKEARDFVNFLIQKKDLPTFKKLYNSPLKEKAYKVFYDKDISELKEEFGNENNDHLILLGIITIVILLFYITFPAGLLQKR